MCFQAVLESVFCRLSEEFTPILTAFAEQLEPSRPCLMVYAMGSTFKGAIDDQPTLNKVLAKYPNMPVYRHLDAALFGGYLPFSRYRCMVNRYSNTIFLKRPSKEIVDKYTLANSYDDAFGGELSHIVVMQHVTKEAIDCFIRDLSSH